MARSPRTRVPRELLLTIDTRRRAAAAELDSDRQRRLGQFLTPMPVASFMASLIKTDKRHLRILEPGAGVGSLIAATVVELCSRPDRPDSIEVVAVEIDAGLVALLKRTLIDCRRFCKNNDVHFAFEIVERDFIHYAVSSLHPQMSFDAVRELSFDVVIQNPPYGKVGSRSRERLLLKRLGVEAGNLYVAFLALGVLSLADEGQLIAITPRSFCNGPYFRPFRQTILQLASFTRFHVLESRSEAFADDGVLQENVIFRAVRNLPPGSVVVTSGNGSVESQRFGRRISHEQLVNPSDPDSFIHLVPEPAGDHVAERFRGLPCTLGDLGLSVSTGRVVDFRAREYLRAEPTSGTAPLIYPGHLRSGFVEWPRDIRKPNAIAVHRATAALLVPHGAYVLVKRFSAKEEARRIVAAVLDPARTLAPKGLGFENHLNYYHFNGNPLQMDVALGLAAFLNSTAVDSYFRQFSGHTQVNASDLRKLRYPTLSVLATLGSVIGQTFPSQAVLDRLVEPGLSPKA